VTKAISSSSNSCFFWFPLIIYVAFFPCRFLLDRPQPGLHHGCHQGLLRLLYWPNLHPLPPREHPTQELVQKLPGEETRLVWRDHQWWYWGKSQYWNRTKFKIYYKEKVDWRLHSSFLFSVCLQWWDPEPTVHGYSAGLHASAGQPGSPEHHLPLQEQHRLHGCWEWKPEEGCVAAGLQRCWAQGRGQQPLHLQRPRGWLQCKFSFYTLIKQTKFSFI